MDFLQEQFLFFLTLAVALFIPGLAFLHAFFDRSFTLLERLVFSLPISVSLVDFSMILLAKSGIILTGKSVFPTLGAIILFCFAVSFVFHKKRKLVSEEEKQRQNPKWNRFSMRQGALLVSILTLTVFIKTVYLSPVILPTSTDLGHHMYWVESIVQTGMLPNYVERNIVEENGVYKLAQPEAIDDFIIGEHLPFAAIALGSGVSVVSWFPSFVLLLVNIFSLLAVFIFILRSLAHSSKNIRFAQTVAIFTLLFLGPIYALASPQAKFVSGGVIGNIFGNLFIPIILFSYWRALEEKSSKMLALAFFLTFALVYTHHLSTLILLFVAVFFVATFSVFHLGKLRQYFSQWMRISLHPAPIVFICVAIFFFFFVLAPSYADPHSLDTALGSPVKATRTGLSFSQLSFSTGEGRLGMGIIGMLFLAGLAAWHQKTKTEIFSPYTIAFFFAWGASILLMSLRPQWLFLDIPSNRIGSYAVFPFAVLSAFAFVVLLSFPKNRARSSLSTGAFLILFTFFVSAGFFDNGQSLSSVESGNNKSQEAVQTFAVSEYLAAHTDESDILLKDHNYIVADAWMKLSFLRGYTYPLSRGLLRRYDDENSPREQCTLKMIATPNMPGGIRCFEETGTSVIVVNPHYDSAQFKKSSDFSLIYQSNDIAAYKRNSR